MDEGGNVRKGYRACAWLRLGVILAVALICGCFKQKIVFRVKPDGSGHIIVSRVFGRDIVARHAAALKEMREDEDEDDPFGSGEGSSISTNDPFFNMRFIEATAGYFGPGVKLAKAREYGREGRRGFVAVYTFEDINKVYLNLRDACPSRESMMPVDDYEDEDGGEEEPIMEVVPKTENAFSFSMEKGKPATLSVHLPKFAEPVKEPESAGEEDEEDEDDDGFIGRSSAVWQMQYALRSSISDSSRSSAFYQSLSPGYRRRDPTPPDIAVAVSVEVDGRVIETTAGHPARDVTNRWTLLSVDMASLMADKKNAKRLESMSSVLRNDPADMTEKLTALPGAVCERQREIRVTFE